MQNFQQEYQTFYEETCSNASTGGKPGQIPFSKPWIQFKDVLLIVFFATPRYEALPYAELINRPFFPNILYCGYEYPSQEKFPLLFDSKGQLRYSFTVSPPSPKQLMGGEFADDCFRNGVRMGYNVEGYLTIADDAVLFADVIQHYNWSNAWMSQHNFVHHYPSAKKTVN